MNVKFSDFVSGSLNSTGFIVGYDSATNQNIRISKSTLDSIYQSKLTLTTTGSSGAATLIGSTLNIPQYSGGGGGGGVTSVTGTAPVVSSGGTTPAISMAAATTSVDGYLTSTNFNTFNNKQAALVSGTNIKTVNGNSLLGSGDLVVGGGGGSQVGYRGFKYTITEQYEGPTPTPSAGQGVVYYADFGEGLEYNGLYLNITDGDGTQASSIFYKLLNKPYQSYVVVNSAGVKTVADSTNISVAGGSGNNVYVFYSPGGPPNFGTSGSVSYIHFTPNNAIPAYTGYAMAGNLNGSTISAGISYLGIGSSTAGSTLTSRNFYTLTPAAFMRGAFITTAGIMTGSMSLKVIANGTFNVNTPYTIPAGSSAGTYQFVVSRPLMYNDVNTLVIEVTQSVTASCGIFGFSVLVA